MGKGKTWFHSTGDGTRNQYDRQQIQSCRDAKHRSADEGRTGTNQRTGIKCNVTGSYTGPHSHKQRIKIWQQENLSFFSPLRFGQINHYQLSADTKPEPVFLYFCHQPPSSRKRTAWCGIFLPISWGIQTTHCQWWISGIRRSIRKPFLRNLESTSGKTIGSRTKCDFWRRCGRRM